MKISADKAMTVAVELVDALRDHCEKIEIAGSLRRRKAEVSDVEIVFVPRCVKVDGQLTTDFFTELPPVNMAEKRIALLLDTCVLAKRPNSKGYFAWGANNKLARHVASGVPVDLFTATNESFYNYLVCRTGSSESNIAICQAARGKGWKWNPYGSGFSSCAFPDRVKVCASEREVFEFVGLPYKEPWER